MLFSVSILFCSLLASCSSKPPQDFTMNMKEPPYTYAFDFSSDGTGAYQITNKEASISKIAALSWEAKWDWLPMFVDYYRIHLQYGIYFKVGGEVIETETLYFKDGYLYPSFSAMDEKRTWERLKF